MNEKPTVFIVAEDAIFCESLAGLVQSMAIPCKRFGCAEDFFAAYSPDLMGCVVSALRMKGMSGLQLQAKLVAMESALPVVVITGHASIPVAVKAMQAGAFAFLEKSCDEHEIWQAINDALNRNRALLKAMQEQNRLQEILISLTPDERRVLELIASGTVNKRIANQLGVCQRTIEDRRQRIMHKLHANSFADLMRFVVKAEQVGSVPKPHVEIRE